MPGVQAPIRWQSRSEAPPEAIAVRSITREEKGSITVTITVSPPDGAQSYALIETIPAERAPYDLTDGGQRVTGRWVDTEWVSDGSQELRWLFFDDRPRGVSYRLSGSGTSGVLSGIVNVDGGANQVIAGDVHVGLSDFRPWNMAPRLYAPAGVTSIRPEFKWAPVQNADGYYLYVKGPESRVAVAQFVSAERADCAVEGVCTIASPHPLTTGKHTWWIIAWREGDGYSDWSSGMHFTVAAGHLAPREQHLAH